MILSEKNDNGDEVSIVLEHVVAWKYANKRITVYVGYHTFAFFGVSADRMESKLRAGLGEPSAALGAH